MATRNKIKEHGTIAQAMGANAPNLLVQAPSIERIDVLGAKLPGQTVNDHHGIQKGKSHEPAEV